eukprot:TRINITY_DN7737_c0_g1_i1.p1 TRINITY_DN7737_c0_g1~~TRINITY_DN7737_c0_g1_i1.p1  ORF type:complete len:875 (+),score=267.96 TRINITY_DN7737_c0_g1_i1:112-2736(+)
MSLFKLREWWSHSIGAEEEFVDGSLTIANIDNDASKQNKIITGSLSGMLRIFMPKERDYKIEDLMLEQNLNKPILQVKAGKFLSTRDDIVLAVLHPRFLTVYQVQPVGGSGSEVACFKLTKCFEHQLGVGGEHFTAANMISGPFGGVRDKDYICVQSMDGQLSFFEHDRHAFTRVLPNCLIPGPLAYCEKTDSIITCNSAYEVESYKYQLLATASAGRAAPGQIDNSGLQKLRPVKPDWSTCIGETAVDIRICRFSKSLSLGQSDIMVVGQHTLFCLREQGTIRLQKRFDYYPSAIKPYEQPHSAEGGSATHNLIVGAHTGQLMIYRDTKLIWAAKAANVPVVIDTASFGGINGMIVTLNDEGKLAVNYLGTDPPTNAVISNDAKEFDYEAMDEEHGQLLDIIRQSQGEGEDDTEQKVHLNIQIPELLDPSEDMDDGEDTINGRKLVRDTKGNVVRFTVKLSVRYRGPTVLENVSLALDVPASVAVREEAILIPKLDGNNTTPLIIPVTFYATSELVPSSTDVLITLCYVTNGEPRTSCSELHLPIFLFGTLVPPRKNNMFKFTLDTNKNPPLMNRLFEDVFQQAAIVHPSAFSPNTGNVMTFVYHNGDDVTILASKTGGRYRIQSANLETLWLISKELVQRLKDYFKKGSGKARLESKSDDPKEPLKINYEETLPLADFFGCIDRHFECRVKMNAISKDMEESARQLRVIEKCLLARFKEKNPQQLGEFETVLNESLDRMMDLANEMEKWQKDLKISAEKLSCATRLILMLMKFLFKLDDRAYKVLEAHLTPVINDCGEQGWEDALEASLNHLLRKTLSKNASDAITIGNTIGPLENTVKLKKHITIVCDRLSKGVPLYKDGKKKSSSSSESK